MIKNSETVIQLFVNALELSRQIGKAAAVGNEFPSEVYPIDPVTGYYTPRIDVDNSSPLRLAAP